MTDELRTELSDILRSARIFLDTVRAVPEPTDKKTTNADKISKARTRAADAKKDLNAIEGELATIDDALRARGRVGDIARRAEKIAEDMARLKGEREDWTGGFKTVSARMTEIAAGQGVELDDKLQSILRPKLIELAKRKGEIADMDGELESILIDSI
jgi:DNA repair exonuclease SbcCD ATPase subunit